MGDCEGPRCVISGISTGVGHTLAVLCGGKVTSETRTQTLRRAVKRLRAEARFISGRSSCVYSGLNSRQLLQ